MLVSGFKTGPASFTHFALLHKVVQRAQRFLIDTATKHPVKLSPEDMAQVWGRIEEHDALERKTIELAQELRKSSTDPVQKALLDYLIVDEQKHDTILGQLEEIKRHMSKLA